MRLILTVALLATLTSCFSGEAQAAIQFGEAVNLNFSAVDATLTDLDDVDGIEFGGNALSSNPTGRIAANGTDTNGSGFLDNGDQTRVVGHAFVDLASIDGGGTVAIDTGNTGRFEFTGVLRNLDGEITGFNNQNTFSAGFLDLYLDVDNAGTDFDVSDVSTSADGTLVATFELLTGATFFTPLGFSSTSIDFKLISQLGNFFELQSGNDPIGLLATQVLSVDFVTNPPETLDGISGGGDPVDIGPGFSPGPPGSFDVVSNVDGSARFGFVPEPASLMVWAGIAAAAGICVRRKIA